MKHIKWNTLASS